MSCLPFTTWYFNDSASTSNDSAPTIQWFSTILTILHCTCVVMMMMMVNNRMYVVDHETPMIRHHTNIQCVSDVWLYKQFVTTSFWRLTSYWKWTHAEVTRIHTWSIEKKVWKYSSQETSRLILLCLAFFDACASCTYFVFVLVLVMSL